MVKMNSRTFSFFLFLSLTEGIMLFAVVTEYTKLVGAAYLQKDAAHIAKAI